MKFKVGDLVSDRRNAVGLVLWGKCELKGEPPVVQVYWLWIDDAGKVDHRTAFEFQDDLIKAECSD